MQQSFNYFSLSLSRTFTLSSLSVLTQIGR